MLLLLSLTPAFGADKPAEPTSFKPYAPAYELRFGAGGGAIHQAELARSGAGHVGASASYGPSEDLVLSLAWDDRFYRQTYLTPAPEPGGGPVRAVRSPEHRQDVALAIAGDALTLMGNGLKDHARLHASLAPRWIRYGHQTHGGWDAGVRAGARLTAWPAPHLHLLGGAGLGVPFFGSSNGASVLGTPLLYSDATAGFGLDFGETPRWSTELAWTTDRVTFQHSLRVMHSAAATLVFSY